MAQTTDPNVLLGNARCLACIPDGMKLDVLIWLYTQLAGVTTDPNVLLANAACLACIPEGSKLDVLIWLATQLSSTGGGGGGTSVLPNGDIFVGNAANVATAVVMSGDATIVNTGVLTTTKFASGNLALNAVTWSAAHGLSATPSKVRAVLVCTGADAASGYAIGDEIFASDVSNSNALEPAFTVMANATNVQVASPVQPVGNEAQFFLATKTGSAYVNPSSFNNFAMKLYAAP